MLPSENVSTTQSWITLWFETMVKKTFYSQSVTIRLLPIWLLTWIWHSSSASFTDGTPQTYGQIHISAVSLSGNLVFHCSGNAAEPAVGTRTQEWSFIKVNLFLYKSQIAEDCDEHLLPIQKDPYLQKNVRDGIVGRTSKKCDFTLYCIAFWLPCGPRS